MNLLHLDSSILGGNSVSRQLSAAIVDRLRAPGVDVVYRDLVRRHRFPTLPGPISPGRAPTSSTIRRCRTTSTSAARAMAEFLAADVVVIGVALYNFTIASQLKAWGRSHPRRRQDPSATPLPEPRALPAASA